METEKITDENLDIRNFIGKVNITESLDEDTLNKISIKSLEQYENDASSRTHKEERLENALKLTLQITEPKNHPWPKASNVIYPILSKACLNFNAEAYPAIIQDGNIVKTRVVGNDDGAPVLIHMVDPNTGQQVLMPKIDQNTGQPIIQGAGLKEQTSERVKEFSNYYIMEKMYGWEENQDKLLMSLPLNGCMFKKIYYNAVDKVAESDLIFPKYLIVNNNTKSLDCAIAITHEYEMTYNEIKEKQNAEIFRDVKLQPSTEDKESLLGESAQDSSYENDNIYTILEQHTWYDLDNDGYKEPYIITIDKESTQVLRIVPRFDEEDIKIGENGEIVKINAKQYFVKYSFLPSMDGSFYDTGFGDLLYPLNKTINSLLNQLIDAGSLANTSQGFIGKSLRLKGGDLSLNMGQFKILNALGSTIRENIVQIKHPEPSVVLFQLLGLILEDTKDLAIQKPIISGMTNANTAPTTMMSLVEEGYKEFKAIYKRIYRALKEEIKMIVGIISEYEDQEDYMNVLDDPRANIEQDFNKKNVDIIPVADPNIVTSIEKFSQIQFLLQFVNDPRVNGKEIMKRAFQVARVPDIDKIILPDQPQQPDPALEIELKKLEQGDKKLEIDEQRAINESERINVAKAEGLTKAATADAQMEKLRSEVANTDADTIKKIAEAEATEVGTQMGIYTSQKESLKEQTNLE